MTGTKIPIRRGLREQRPDGTFTVSNGTQHPVDGLTEMQAKLVCDMLRGEFFAGQNDIRDGINQILTPRS